MDSGPLNRFAAAKTLAHRFQHRTVRPDLRMAIHAGLGRRNARERALFHRGVAVTAIDAVVADMMLVTERHRLATCDTDVGDVGRLINCRQRQNQDDDETGAAKNGETGNGVGARMKNLRHDLLLCRGAAKPAQSRIT